MVQFVLQNFGLSFALRTDIIIEFLLIWKLHQNYEISYCQLISKWASNVAHQSLRRIYSQKSQFYYKKNI